MRKGLGVMGLELFDGDGLGEVAGLVDIGAPFEGDIIGQKLAGHGIDDAGQFIADVGEPKDVGSDFVHFGGAFRGESEDGASSGLDFHEVAEHLFKGAFVAAHADDSEVGVDEGDGAMLHFAGGVALGVDVADLLEFEGGL